MYLVDDSSQYAAEDRLNIAWAVIGPVVCFDKAIRESNCHTTAEKSKILPHHHNVKGIRVSSNAPYTYHILATITKRMFSHCVSKPLVSDFVK